jgi:hypothetical protein
LLNTKRKNIFKSFRFRITVLILLLIGAAVLAYLKFKPDAKDEEKNMVTVPVKSDTSKTLSSEIQNLSAFLDKNIDSVLSTFGIRKEWINTLTSSSKPSKDKKDSQKKSSTNASLFTKNVTVHKDVTSAEVNLDISALIHGAGLYLQVNEDIKTTDIEINIYKDSSSTGSIPLVKINIVHSDKISRESGTIVVVLNNISEYKKEELDEMLKYTSEFSFVLPRNLDDIELQNRLIHDKKDMLINLTIGDKEAVDADFGADMDDKQIKQKVKSFNVDFPSVKNVILNPADANIRRDNILNNLSVEFAKFDIKTYPDTVFFRFPDVEITLDKVGSVINTLKAKAGATGKVLTILSINYDAFKVFYNEVLTLKKQGFKFYSYSQYLLKEADRLKKELLQKQKKEEEEKKKNEKKQPPKKQVDKKDVKKKPQDSKKKETTTKKPVKKK